MPAYSNIGYKFDRWLDNRSMQRALGPGASKRLTAQLATSASHDRSAAP
jgi:hypothetical protein